ncbi:MAG: NAD-dependent epimerase/dehydratase family protein [Methylobacter sp.]
MSDTNIGSSSDTPFDMIIGLNDQMLVTGANGFIGKKVVKRLLEYGFKNIKCLVRSSASVAALKVLADAYDGANIDVVVGNLLSRADCDHAAQGATVVFHLAAGRGEKAVPQAYMDTVVTTRNLLDSLKTTASLRRFVNVSSFSVYSNFAMKHGSMLDESCEVDTRPELRGDAYTFAKVGQEEIVKEYAQKYAINCVTLRPGVVIGPGNKGIHGRIGIGTFGIFLHLGGNNRIPLTFVDNCADAIVLAGIKPGIDGQVFNVVDDDLPTSKEFLSLYKSTVRRFRSIYVPYWLWYFFCFCWERYSAWSEGQLPPTFNQRMCSAYWKRHNYSNTKLKTLLEWRPCVAMKDALRSYFEHEKSAVIKS